MSSSSDTIKPTRTLRRRKKKSKFYSTPILGAVCSPGSISASAIDTSSSWSTKRKIIQTDLGNERRKRKRFRNERSGKVSKDEKLWETSNEKELRKKINRTGEQREEVGKRAEKKVIEGRESEYDWKTCDETVRRSSEVEENFLSKDIPSPEHIRDAPCFTTDLFCSPNLRSRNLPTTIAGSPRRIICHDDERTLHVKDLACSFGFGDSDEEEEEELILNRQSNVKTYPGKRKARSNKGNVTVDKCKAWLVDVAVPTASSDLLWNDFIEKNYGKDSKYLARPSNDKRDDSNVQEKRINNDTGEFSGQTNYWSEETNLLLRKYRKKMNVVRGSYDKSSRTWINVEEVYNFPGKKDNELEKHNGNTGKMTLNEFLHKRRAEKRNAIGLDLNSSSPICRRDVENSFSISRHPPDKEKMVRKSSRGNSKSASEKRKKAMADVSPSELQRINDIHKFASRLNAKKKAMISNEASLLSTSKNDRPSCTVTSLERTYRDDVDEKQVENKRLSSPKRTTVPKIKSIEILHTVRFEKDRQTWRII